MSKALQLLILEDNELDAALEISELRNAGFDPQWTRVETEEEFLAGIEHAPHLILADYSLPRFDGLTALKLLRERSPDIPFILVSGMLGEETAVDVMKNGATDFILKHHLNRLPSAVERALEESRLREENRRSVAALRVSEERVRLAMEAAQMGSWEWDTLTNEIIWSPYHEIIFGYQPGQPHRTYLEYRDRVHPADWEFVAAAAREAVANRSSYQCEYRIVWPDGTIRWVSSLGRLRSGDGAHRMVGMVRDITARKETEEALRRSERIALNQSNETMAVLEAIPANIAILDSDGVILRVNHAWKTFSEQNGGQDDRTGVGVNYLHVFDSAADTGDDTAGRFAAGIRSVIRGDVELFSMEYACHAPTAQRWFIGYVTAARFNHHSFRAVIAHVDITQQKLIQEEIRTLNQELESRVIARTAKLRAAAEALQQEIDKRMRLEREILEISEREQSRFGQDLHDGIGQELAGVALISNVLAEKLKNEAHPEAATAANITTYIRDSIESTRRLAKGLYPIELDRYGLLLALEDLANQTTQRFGVDCELKQLGELPELDHTAQIHIYRIVQESISNAIKHGKASKIMIESIAADGCYTLSITNDGVSFQKKTDNPGMGLHLMNYRARVIGAEVEMEAPPEGGCRVTCFMRI